MVYLNEWLPNPKGSDSAKEFIELYNAGDGAVSLNGYHLVAGKKKFALAGYSIGANQYLVLKTSKTKLTLKNTEGGVSLYGPNGALVDSGSFVGSAPEGKSFSRVDYGSADTIHFAFVDPSPGAPNKPIHNEIAQYDHPIGVPLNHGATVLDIAGIVISTGIFLAATFIYVIKKNEILSKLFFRRDQEVREIYRSSA